MDDHTNPTHFEIHVRGQLSDRLLSAFPEMQARTRNHETVLTGPLPDQSALHGVLARIEALGLELLEVRRARTQHGTVRGPTRLVHGHGSGWRQLSRIGRRLERSNSRRRDADAYDGLDRGPRRD